MLKSFMPKSPQEKTAQELAQEGMEYLRQGSYHNAVQSFQLIKDRYPFSQYGLLASLKLADAHYFKEEYEEALAGYREFEKLHPTNEALPYVGYQTAMCYFKQILSEDRDQAVTQNAVNEFQRLLNTYPSSPYTTEAHQKLKECRDCLARHELYVGKFYYRIKKYEAALKRAKKLMIDYPDSSVKEEAASLAKKCEKHVSPAGIAVPDLIAGNPNPKP